MTAPFVHGSEAQRIVDRLVKSLGRAHAHRAVDLALGKFSHVELAALAADWNFWARPKQLAPEGEWRSWGFLGARGMGKTRACSEYVNTEVEAGRAGLLLLIAQKEDSCVEIQVEGPSGLIATAPPWFKPKFEASDLQLVWPNGARAFVRTPEAPGAIRGLEYELGWATELQSWPVTTRAEAWMNVLLSVRRGYARTIWDCTPKRGHPILKELLARAGADPQKHRVVRGTTRENAMNLGAGYVEDLERAFAGTARGEEELEGKMLDDAENPVAQQAWIDRARRPAPHSYVRRGIGIDPAITTRRGSDLTGIVEAGLGADGQGYVIGNRSGKHTSTAWADIVLDTYVQNACCIVVVETNRGGELVTSVLRSAATSKGLTIVVLGPQERPRHVHGIVYVKEVHASGPKLDRAQPVSTAYEKGRISHVRGADLASLEETLSTWEPTVGADSPDDLDALVHIMTELLELTNDVPDPAGGFPGIEDFAARLSSVSTTRRI